MGNQVMVIAEKETFLVRVLLKKIEEAGLTPVFVIPYVDEIGEHWADSDLISFYMDTNEPIRDDVLRFLTDKMEDTGKQIILIGDSPDIRYVETHMPKNLIYESFVRPLDSDKFIEKVKSFLAMLESGALKKSILIVDDDPTYLNLVRSWLREDYKVAMVTSGLQAIKWLGRNKADLILLDHEMPVTSGPQVLEMLRSDNDTKNIPVIFLTGKSDKESVMAVVNLKPEGYLLKNIAKPELLAKINEFFILRS